MGISLKQSQTARPLVFNLRLSSDHVTGATGKSPTVTLSKNGAAYASPAGAVTEIGNGDYKVAANATDANTLGGLRLYATAAGCDPAFETFEVVAYNPDGALDSNLIQIQGSSFVADAAVPVDLTQAVGDTQTAGTVGAAMLAAEAQGVGKWVLDPIALTLTIYRADGITAVKTFNLDSATVPLSRT